MITVLTLLVSLGTYLTTKGRAKQEAEEISKKWFADNGSEFTDEIEKLRKRVSIIQNEVEEHANKTKKKMDEDGQKIATAAQLKIFPPDPSIPSKPSDEDLQTVNDANQTLKAKAENDFTANDFYVRGLSEYSEKRFDSALINFEKALQAASTEQLSSEEIAKFMFATANTQKQLGHTDDAIKIFDLLEQRYGKDPNPALREQVAQALIHKGIALGQSGRHKDAITVFDLLEQRYGSDNNPVLREHVARALVNKGVALEKMDRNDDAIAAFDRFEQHYDSVDNHVLHKLAALGTLCKSPPLVCLT